MPTSYMFTCEKKKQNSSSLTLPRARAIEGSAHMPRSKPFKLCEQGVDSNGRDFQEAVH